MTISRRFSLAFLVVMAASLLALMPLQARAGDATVDLSHSHQVVRGFGGASVWLGALNDTEMDSLFGNSNSNQIGLSLLRVRIAPDKNWSAELSNAQKATARGASVIATPWTPPASMKTN